VISISVAGTVDFDENAGEVWIAWCQGIPEIVLDLIRNAVYASNTLPDPWNSMSKEKADMWLRVDYSRKYVLLTLANACHLKHNELRSSLKAYRWQALTDLEAKSCPFK